MIINCAVVGTGIGLKHIEAIDFYKNFRVKSICEFDKKKIKFLKRKFPKKIFFDNFDDIVKDKTINLISIASYDEFHYSQIIKSIDFKKNIIVEKPMCLKSNELLKIINKLKKKKIFLTSNFVLRTEPIFLEMKKMIEQKKLFYIEADYLWGRLHKLTNGWRNKTKEYSIILGAAIHMIDIILWMIGKYPTKITSFGNKILTKNSKFKKFSFVNIVMEFTSGLIVKITANATDSFHHSHQIKIFQTNQTLIQEESVIKKISKVNKQIKSESKKIQYPFKKNRKQFIRSFLDHLSGDSKLPYDFFKKQFDLMSICFAAEKSLLLNKKVKIKYL